MRLRRYGSLSTLWQNTTMGIVSTSFILATAGYEPAYDLWINGWEGIMAFLGLGVGMKMAQRSTEKYIEEKYKSPSRDIEGY